MAVLRVECPSCDADLKIANLSLAGKAVKCPKCGGRLTLPELEDEQAEERPRKAKKQMEREEEDDDRPRKKRKKAPSGSSMTRNLIGGGILLVLLAVAGAVWLNRSKVKDKDIAAGGTTNSPADKTPPESPPPKKPTDSPSGETNAKTGAAKYDVAKLGYDPSRVDQTIPAGRWPRRSSPGDTSLAAYNGKIIATEGWIIGMRLLPWANKDIPGRQLHFELIDSSGQIYTTDGRVGGFLNVRMAEGADWKQFRPGQVVKVVGQATTPRDAPTSLWLQKAVLVSVTGEGYPPVTTEPLIEDLVKNTKSYSLGSTATKHFTLNATFVSLAPPGQDTRPRLLLAHPTMRIICAIGNEDELAAKPPKPGDSVTIIGGFNRYKQDEKEVTIDGLYLPN